MADDELLAVARRLFGTRTERDVYEVAVDSLVRLTDADECAVAARENGDLVSQVSVTTGLIDAPEGPLADEFGLIEQAHRERETVIVADLMDSSWGWQFHESDPDTLSAADGRAPYRSLLCVPLESGGMLVATADCPGAFDRQTRQTAEGIGSLVEDAVEKFPEPAPAATSDPDHLETQPRDDEQADGRKQPA
jgi:GAF domain-containing protein